MLKFPKEPSKLTLVLKKTFNIEEAKCTIFKASKTLNVKLGT